MVYHGLKGITCVETAISRIDGEKGKLIYRGYNADELALSSTFEEVAYLILNGAFPTEAELSRFNELLASFRVLPEACERLIRSLPAELDDMAVLRTAVSSFGDISFAFKPTMEQALRLIAAVPSIIAFRKRLADGEEPVQPLDELGFVENYFYMLKGKRPTEAEKSA